MNVLLRLLNGLGRLAQRNSRRQIEGERDHRELSLMIHRQSGIGGFEVAERSEWNLGRPGSMHVNVLERIRILRKLRINFEHHVILVQLGEDGGDLALSEGVVESVVDGLRQDAEPGCGVAIDHQVSFQAAILLIRGHVAHGGQFAQFGPPVWAPRRTIPESRHLPSSTDTGCGSRDLRPSGPAPAAYTR